MNSKPKGKNTATKIQEAIMTKDQRQTQIRPNLINSGTMPYKTKPDMSDVSSVNLNI